MGPTYRIYGDLCLCGLGPMGFTRVYGIAVLDLWDSPGSMGLRSPTYGESMGCLGVCWIAVWDLWDSYVSMGLRCVTYGMPRGLWDCGVGRMGFLCVYGTAVSDLWGNYGVAPLRSHT